MEPLSPVNVDGTSRDTRTLPFLMTCLQPLHLALAVGARDTVNREEDDMVFCSLPAQVLAFRFGPRFLRIREMSRQ